MRKNYRRITAFAMAFLLLGGCTKNPDMSKEETTSASSTISAESMDGVLAESSSAINEPTMPEITTEADTISEVEPTTRYPEQPTAPLKQLIHALRLTDGIGNSFRITSENQATPAFIDSYDDFTVRLVQSMHKDGSNSLISPLSIMSGLAMVANGADGSTKEQFEKAMGNGLSLEEINPSMYALLGSLYEREGFSVANSIWINEDLSIGAQIREDFLNTNVRYYNAEVYKTPFDNKALTDLNNWVSNNTDGMIPKWQDQISDDAAMILINTLCIDAKWLCFFDPNDTHEAEFTDSEGNTKLVDMMNSGVNITWDGENYTGIMLEYDWSGFVFVALLPNEGVSADELLKQLNSQHYEVVPPLGASELYRPCMLYFPRFDFEAEYDLKDAMEQLGITDVFDPATADLSGITKDASLFLREATHKMSIQVTEGGTRCAGYSSILAGYGGGADSGPTVIAFDRPFVFMLTDLTYGLPIVVGVVNHID